MAVSEDTFAVVTLETAAAPLQAAAARSSGQMFENEAPPDSDWFRPDGRKRRSASS